ncbi:insulinase family protein [Anaerococcus sp.]|uniref:insulinase family protein n=1 Tax=Anaerococcus sp. TaxID=1872515 RepID=UPI0029005064|nr:insulinase family protein [Anaerococcus sp.]MDU1829050.1 insulinase family protein [Anaerococcus sp.]MDU1864839.1 insulinase family protein [Anaerococcus sp.]
MTYTLKEKQTYKKMGVTVFLYEHNKTKAQVAYVKNDDHNKTFGIGFKTPPTNSKGMAHIMEHSVLNGSKKYRTREPFMDMASSSLQTFLNAMTYPDKTVYPVSSENDKDFFNLTDVYLDAVFNPQVINKKEILDQEGWHYVMEDGKITGISGVVYNEMKGALTDPDELVYDDFISYLYKNSPYQYESGGDPAEIYKLSFDEFKEFYKNHYHPSNAYIYFYGDLDIDFYLDHLDKEYLSNYEYKNLYFNIEVPSNQYDKIIESTYPASRLDESSDYLVYGFLTKENTDTKYYLTLLILLSALFHMDSSKIRNQIYEQIDPEDFTARVGYGVRSSIILQAQKTDASKLDRFIQIIENGLKEASKGMNKESLKSAFSIFEYGQREQLISVMRGLTYFLMWSFEKPVFESFKIVDYLDELRDLIDTDYYENFIRDNFIDNPTKLIYIAKPSPKYKEEKQAELKSYIENLNSTMTKEKLELIRTDLERLDIHQNKKDNEEEKATIPVLNIKDVETHVEKTPREIVDDKFKYVYHNIDTAGLIYTSLYFDVDHLSLDELRYLSLINDFMGSVDTNNLPYTQIDDILFQNLSSPNFSNAFISINDKDSARLEKVSFTSTIETIEKSIDLIANFMFNSKFDNKKRIIELLRMRKSYFESTMYDNGHILAINRANSHIDENIMLKDELSGIGSYLFTKEVINQVQEDFDGFINKLNDIYKKIFTSNLEVNITGSRENFLKVKKLLNNKFNSLDKKENKVKLDFIPKSYKEAIISGANVNYVAKSANIKELKSKFNGKIMLATTILSNPYLYELIRAKGGAYGAGLTISKNGLLSAYSYRDPNILKTIENFDKISDLTKNIDISKRDFENQKISSMGSILRPKSPSTLADEDYVRYKKENPIDPEKLLSEIKTSTLDEIKAYNDLFKKSMQEENICVFGNRENITDIKNEFDKIIDLND